MSQSHPISNNQESHRICHGVKYRPEDDARSASSAQRLQQLGYTIDLPGLTKALQASEVAVRTESAFLLGYKRESAATEVLLRSLVDSSAKVRVEAALALASLGNKEQAIPVLRKELQGELFQDAPLRAARALALLDDPTGYGRVMTALASPLPSNRMEAIAVLPAFFRYAGQNIAGQTIDPVAALATAASDPEPILRRDALSAIAQSEDTRSTSLLQAAVNDPDQTVRELAQYLLDSLLR